jgi:hypothetical protein
MKRLIAAVALIAVAVPVFAQEYGPPYSQLDVDRALPQIEFAPVEEYVANEHAPFEQLAIDRAQPNLPGPDVQYAESAADGSTRSDAGVDHGDAAQFESPWAHDHNFIAPAQ